MSLKRPAFPQINYELKQSDTGVWYVHWTEGRRSKRKSTRTRDLPEARLFLADWLAGSDAPFSKELPTCEQLWRFYVDEHVKRKCVSCETQRHAWKKLGPVFGHLTPTQVSQSRIDLHVFNRWPVKESSVRQELCLLQASWRHNVKRKRLTSEDLPVLAIPASPPPRARWFRQHEIDRLFAAAEAMRVGDRLSRVERFMWLALHTAGRRDALRMLQWDQVDFEMRIIHLNPDGRRQTSKKRASVPISDALMPILERAWSERQTELVLDHDHRLHELLDRVAERAGVEGVTAHVFRHTAATWMARRGVSLWKISKVLGNSLEQVERVYAKFNVEDLRAGVNLISKPPAKEPEPD